MSALTLLLCAWTLGRRRPLRPQRAMLRIQHRRWRLRVLLEVRKRTDTRVLDVYVLFADVR